MKLIQTFVVCLVLSTYGSCCLADERLRIAVSMKPAYEAVTGWSIESTLTNTGEQPIVVADAYLPWGNRYAMILAAFTERRPNTILAVGYPVDDPLFNRITIPPKSSVTGRMRLADYVPDISRALGSGGVIVVWSYQLIADDGRASERVAGSFALPGVKKQ